MNPESSPLQLRRAPAQARARQTFEQLLTTTAELLEEVGFEAFNTNLLARRSGIGTRAIYRYFPNKHALLSELARRMGNVWHAALEDPSIRNGRSWVDAWPDYLDRYVDVVRGTRGGIVVLQAMRIHPELRKVDEEINTRYVAELASALRSENRQLSPATAKRIASILMCTVVAVIDTMIDEKPAAATAQLDMLKTMHRALLASFAGSGRASEDPKSERTK